MVSDVNMAEAEGSSLLPGLMTGELGLRHPFELQGHLLLGLCANGAEPEREGDARHQDLLDDDVERLLG